MALVTLAGKDRSNLILEKIALGTGELNRRPRIGELPYLVTLPPYGFFWFHLRAGVEDEPEKVLPREITTLVLGQSGE